MSRGSNAPTGPRSARAVLAEVAASQHGVILGSQVRALGIRASTFAGWVRAGQFVRVADDVSVVAGSAPSVDQAATIAVLGAAADAVLGGAWAAAWWGLGQRPWGDDLLVSLPILIAPRAANARYPRAKVVRVSDMRADDMCALDHETHARVLLEATDRRRGAHGGNTLRKTTRRALRPAAKGMVADLAARPLVTTPLRTVVDLARVAADAALPVEQLLDDAIAQGYFTPEEFADRVALLNTRSPGSAALRRLAEARGAGFVVADSELERDAAVAFAEWRLPAPVRQHGIPGREDQPGRVDFAWPQQRVILEANSRRWHASTLAQARDAERDRAALNADWKPYRYWHEDLRPPRRDRTRDELRRALRLDH
jgi:hypothetical protein